MSRAFIRSNSRCWTSFTLPMSEFGTRCHVDRFGVTGFSSRRLGFKHVPVKAVTMLSICTTKCGVGSYTSSPLLLSSGSDFILEALFIATDYTPTALFGAIMAADMQLLPMRYLKESCNCRGKGNRYEITASSWKTKKQYLLERQFTMICWTCLRVKSWKHYFGKRVHVTEHRMHGRFENEYEACYGRLNCLI